MLMQEKTKPNVKRQLYKNTSNHSMFVDEVHKTNQCPSPFFLSFFLMVINQSKHEAKN